MHVLAFRPQMSFDYTPVGLAGASGVIGQELIAATDHDEAFRILTALAVREVPGTQFAGITQGYNHSFRTIAATDEAVSTADEIQYELRSGPCVDAILHRRIFDTDDLPNDERWPEFGRRAYESTGILSMLSFRLFLEDHTELIASLNLYSRSTTAFDDTSHALGLILATHGALAVSAALAREKAYNLNLALQSSREIGIAIGVLMVQHKITREEAFDLLRLASQHTHRKLAQVASDVADTGALPLPVEDSGKPQRN